MLTVSQLKKLFSLSAEVGADGAMTLLYIYEACIQLNKTKGVSSIRRSQLKAIEQKIGVNNIRVEVVNLEDVGYLEIKNDTITYTTKAHDLFKKKKTQKKKLEYTPEFEKLWEQYGRLGSKQNAFEEWLKLSKSDKQLVEKTLDLYLKETTANRSKDSVRQWRKDFERYLRHGIYENYEPEEDMKELTINSPEWFEQQRRKLRAI